MAVVAQMMHVLPIGWVEPVDISNAVLFLASDEARYVGAADDDRRRQHAQVATVRLSDSRFR
jgi:NAD(P)-dependent dehydrogenase (short-subunit alcohol dehydrogenase family)